MAKCPQKHSPQWKALVNKIGVREAYREFIIYGDIPDAENYPSLLSDLSDTGKIINVNFPKDDVGERVYTRSTEDTIISLFQDKRVLFMSGQLPIIIPRDASKVGWYNKTRELLLQLPENSTDAKELVGKSLSELFGDIKRGDNAHFDIIGCFIASRLLQSSDNFSGRVLANLSKDRLVVDNFIKIENSIGAPLYYVEDGAFHINIVKLAKEIEKFDNYEDFIKATELVLTEEVIHLVALAKASNEEMMQIYNELTTNEKIEFKKTYRTNDPILVAHEYVRTIIQEDIFGTSTARELNPTEKSVITKALEYIINLFRSNPNRYSTVVINRIKQYIDSSKNNYFQLKPASEEPVDKALNQKIKEFLNSIGVTITDTGEIRDTQGNIINTVAKSDILNRTIDFVNGLADITTLPEEAAHFYVAMLPEESLLLEDMMTDIRKRDIYLDTYNQYKNNDDYLNADGTVNEDKITKEAIGKLIAGTIVGTYKDNKAKSFWRRLFEWLKSIFKGTDFNSYEIAASDILGGKISKLDINAAIKANQNGEIYYQLSPRDEEFIETVKKNANPVQRAIIDDIYLKPENRVVLDEDAHTYSDLLGTKYTSVTQAIHGNFVDSAKYENNRLWGNNFDAILQGIILGKKPREIVTPNLTDEIKEDAYLYIYKMLQDYTSDGSVALTQVVVGDPLSGIAGSIDLLLISPTGKLTVVDLKTSWNSIKGNSYTTAYKTGEGAVIDGKLSKKQSHGIQVGSYAKLLELQGYPGADTHTRNILLTIKNKNVNSFEDEGIVVHSPSANQIYIDTVIPTPYQGKGRLVELGFENPVQSKDFQESIEKDNNSFEGRVRSIDPLFDNWKEYLRSISNHVGFRPRDQTIAKIDELWSVMENEIQTTDKGYSIAYTEFLKFTKSELANIIAYLGNSKNITSPDYIKIAAVAQQYLNTFRGIVDTKRIGNDFQKNLADEVIEDMRAAQNLITKANTDSVKENVIADNTSNSNYKGAILDGLVTKQQDISTASLFVGDLANSGLPLLENTDKFIKRAAEVSRENTEETINEKIYPAANRLIEASGGKKDSAIYDFMYQRKRDGKKSGRIVSQLGQTYWDRSAVVEEPLINYDGSRKQYIEIGDVNTDKLEDVEYNKNLWYLKQANRKFKEAENVEVDSDLWEATVEDGEYHKYTDEFKELRNKYMYLNNVGKWVPKKNDKEFLNFRSKYFNYVEYTTVVVDSKGKPTGVTQSKSEWFPKKENVVVRGISANGIDLRDEGYKKMMNPTTSLERAQSEFYKAYVDIMGELVQKLPPQAMVWFQKGFIPTLKGNFIKMLGQRGADTNKIILAELRDMFSVTAHTNQSEINKTGSIRQQIPILFMGRLQSQVIINKIETEIENLAAKRNIIPLKEYQKKSEELQELLKKENSKLTGEDIEPDLTIGLVAFTRMAENFNAMSAIENQLLAVRNVIGNMEFTTSGGKTIEGLQSNAYRRFSEWMEMCFYNDENYTKDIAEVIAKRVQNLTSVLAVPFKVFGNINNAVIGTLNNFLDSFGNDFYNMKSIRRMSTTEFPKAMAGIIANMGTHTKEQGTAINKGTKYGDRKFGSKYEALSHYFNMIEHYQVDTGKVDWLAKFGGYLMQEGGEWMMQSKVGCAILDSIQVTNDKGESISLYDAYNFDPNTGKLSLKEGYSLEQKEKHLITNRIRETNKRIHGNYRPIDRTLIEKYWLGSLAMQFHKWVTPAIQARYRKGKYDENLGGGMDIEGRWVTAWGFIKSLKDLGFNVQKTWGTLTQHQKSNLKKDLMEALTVCTFIAIGTVVKGLAEGLDDDDPYTKRMANWLQYQSNRGVQEVGLFIPIFGEVEAYQMVKSPFAVANTLMNFAQVLKAGVEYPFLDDENRYLKRGPHKGESHLWKETKDIAPLFNTLNQWEAFDNVINFYIR